MKKIENLHYEIEYENYHFEFNGEYIQFYVISDLIQLNIQLQRDYNHKFTGEICDGFLYNDLNKYTEEEFNAIKTIHNRFNKLSFEMIRREIRKEKLKNIEKILKL